ncbi:MAG: diguanylate cyclase, partial [Chloroflexota bacterium]
MLERVFTHLPVASFVVDENKVVLAVNKEARRLLGACDSAIGKETCRSLCGCCIPEGKCPLKKAFLRRSSVYRAEIPVSTSHGKRIRIERIATFQEPDSGERLAVITCGDATGYFRRLRRLRQQAHVDVLTRLLNRRHFDEAVSRSRRRERRKQPSLFVMIDVNGLKQINDLEGHAAGDAILRRLGNLL